MPDPVTIPLSVDSLDDAPESHRRLYTEDKESGKFVLDGGGLHRALESEREANRAARLKAKEYEGVDPTEFKRLKEESEAAERQRNIDAGNFEKILGEEKTKLQAEIDVQTEKASRLEKALSMALIDSAAVREIVAQDGNPKLLLSSIKDVVRMQEVEGNTQAVVMDAKGKPRLKAEPENANDFMGVAELVAEMKEDQEYAAAFKGTGSRGSGAPTTKLSGVTDDRTSKQKSEIAKIAAQVKRGETGTLTA